MDTSEFLIYRFLSRASSFSFLVLTHPLENRAFYKALEWQTKWFKAKNPFWNERNSQELVFFFSSEDCGDHQWVFPPHHTLYLNSFNQKHLSRNISKLPFSFLIWGVLLCLWEMKMEAVPLQKQLSANPNLIYEVCGKREMGMWFTHVASPRQMSSTLLSAILKSPGLLNTKKNSAKLFVTMTCKHKETKQMIARKNVIKWKLWITFVKTRKQARLTCL